MNSGGPKRRQCHLDREDGCHFDSRNLQDTARKFHRLKRHCTFRQRMEAVQVETAEALEAVVAEQVAKAAQRWLARK